MVVVPVFANFVVSYGATDTARYELIGTRGRLSLDHAYDLVEPMELELIQDGKRRTRTFKKRDQVAAEVDYFARCVREDREPEPSAEEGLADIHVILAIEESMRTGRVVAVDAVEQHRRPDPDQEIRFPMHRRPELVDVESPSQ